MLDSYVSNHSYSLGKVYRVINRRSDLPNGYHSYIVRGVRIIDGSLQDDSFVEEIDVPGENLNYYTHDDNKNSSRLEFIMVIYTEGEHKTIFFNNESSLLSFCNQNSR